MDYQDILISDFSDVRFQQAFRAYFTEEGMHIKNWDALFAEMNSQQANAAFLRLDRKGNVVGFLQFQPGEMSHWFFREPIGFIREFWIAKPFRRKGHGSQLLLHTETYFVEQGLGRAILTAEKAEGFYLCHGYKKDLNITAKNKMSVFSKQLER